MRDRLRRLVCLSGLSLAGWAAQAVDIGAVTVDAREGGFFGHLNVSVRAPLNIVREVLTDFEHMPAFVPNLESSRLLEQQGNVYRVSQRGVVHWGPFSQSFASERRIEWFPDGRLVSDGSNGQFRRLHSEMRLQTGATGMTVLDYRIEMTPEGWLPAFFGTRFMQHELAEQFAAMGREMEQRAARRAESGAVPEALAEPAKH